MEIDFDAIEAKLRKKFESDIRELHAAKEVALRLSGSGSSTMKLNGTATASVRQGSAPLGSTLVSVDSLVKLAIAQISGDFTLGDVAKKMAELYPERPVKKTAISNAIYRLKKDKAVIMKKDGQGQKPAVYTTP